MVRAGGLSLVIVGFTILAGALLPRKRRLLLMFGFVTGTVMIVLFSAPLAAPLGNPTPVRFWFLFGAIGLEIVLIRFANACYSQAGERSRTLATLFVVGLHFLPMAVALGPMCFVLGLVLCTWSGVGLGLRLNLPLDLFWGVDGVFKIAFGALMFFAP